MMSNSLKESFVKKFLSSNASKNLYTVLLTSNRSIDMYPTMLIIGVALAVSLLTIPIIVHNFRGSSRNTEGTKWLEQHGKRVIALVTEIKTAQDWKYENGSQWNAWEGGYQQARKWQTIYGVTARWTDGQTKLNYFFDAKVWSDEIARKPAAGNTVSILFDPRHPERYHVDLQSFS
jgi:hypothetical protein